MPTSFEGYLAHKWGLEANLPAGSIDAALMDAHLKSGRFGVLLGAIAVLGESNRLLRLETEDLEGS